jgi:hypothetical protein
MRFQPLGYRFDIESPLRPEDAKAAIRKGLVNWFDPSNQARGWVVGPFLCLWRSAFDRYGPMVFARISDSGSGTRVSGRAGSDLNGVAVMLVLTPLLAFALFKVAEQGDLGTGAIVWLGLVLALFPFIIFMSHKDRRDADPLVHYVRQALVPAMASAPAANEPPIASIRLMIGDRKHDGPVSDEAVGAALASLSRGEFLVIEVAPETYIQVRAEDDAFRVEKREGVAGQHFAAFVPKGSAGSHREYDAALRQIAARLSDYLHGREPGHDLNWKRISV